MGSKDLHFWGTTETVPLSSAKIDEVYWSEEVMFRNHREYKSPLVVGYNEDNEIRFIDLKSAHNILIAGSNNEYIPTMVSSIMSSTEQFVHHSQLKWIILNPQCEPLPIKEGWEEYHRKTWLAKLPSAKGESYYKTVFSYKLDEMSMYLESTALELEKRTLLFDEAKVRTIEEYNAVMKSEGKEILPRIVVFIFELADILIPDKSCSSKSLISKNLASINKIGSLGGSSGIHLVVATQRPSNELMSGLIKSNFPTRIGFRMCSGCDSKLILDDEGAERLGDDKTFILQREGNREILKCFEPYGFYQKTE